MRWLDGITDTIEMTEQALGDGEAQGRRVCCCPWGPKESDTTEWLNNRVGYFFLLVGAEALINKF